MDVGGETTANGREEPVGEHTAFNAGLCHMKMVKGNKFANSRANTFLL